MRPNSKLDVAHKQAVNTQNHGQAVVTATRRGDAVRVHVSMWRKMRGAAHGVSSLDMTVGQAMRLRQILTEAIRSASHAGLDDDAALDGASVATNAARGAGGEDRQHGRGEGVKAA
ncbi:hypothetical protein Q8W71_06820 [Methylobacterium sp. NEAU 140]|uniref:hypothetical protein n=1 Tax=Methylobacterium sp. NEAU 140 TaxID=3064945 RepID=UPI0027372241|nr:hypothetical protein [Methylobacterium sp. NEAU 140]MDP4022329.1 hypothetical protein [Methylobacterium sp. NEAU 140]